MDKQQIRDLFKTHDLQLSQKDVWDVKGKPVILHSALERLAAHLELTWDLPTMIRVTDTEVVVLARATRKDGIAEWSFGEVKIGSGDGGGANYLIKGKQPGYPFAMAEKRAKDRVIIKLAGMHGAYSEEEAEDFKARNQGEDGRQGGFVDADGSDREGNAPEPDERPEVKPEPEAKPQTRRRAADAAKSAPKDDTGAKGAPEGGSAPANDDEPGEAKELRKQIKGARTINAVTDLMLKPETQEILNKLPEDQRNSLREAGKERLRALGWPNKGSEAAA